MLNVIGFNHFYYVQILPIIDNYGTTKNYRSPKDWR